MRRFKLLKDIPSFLSHGVKDIKAGEVFELIAEDEPTPFIRSSDYHEHFYLNTIKKYPEWFEELKEPEKPKEKERAYYYLLHIEDKSHWGVSEGVFSSLEEAKKNYENGFGVEWPALPDSEGYYPGPKRR